MNFRHEHSPADATAVIAIRPMCNLQHCLEWIMRENLRTGCAVTNLYYDCYTQTESSLFAGSPGLCVDGDC